MSTKKTPSKRELNLLFNYNRTTGKLYWRKRRRRSRATLAPAGSTRCDGYRKVTICGVEYLEHRVIWKLVYGKEPSDLDHINRNKADNRLDNLRETNSRFKNTWNLGLRKNNSSGIPGVSYHKHTKKYIARIGAGYGTQNLGAYDCPLLAGLAYKKAKTIRDLVGKKEKDDE